MLCWPSQNIVLQISIEFLPSWEEAFSVYPSVIIIHVHVSGQSYKASTIVIYDSRVVPDWKIPHITTLES